MILWVLDCHEIFRLSKTLFINRHNREKKSIGILLAIIVVFAVCHVFRLAVQILEIFSPRHGLLEHYERCEAEGRLHVPALAYILGK